MILPSAWPQRLDFFSRRLHEGAMKRGCAEMAEGQDGIGAEIVETVEKMAETSRAISAQDGTKQWVGMGVETLSLPSRAVQRNQPF